MSNKSISQLITEFLERNNNESTLHEIYDFILFKQNLVVLNARDPKKSIRGVISKMKKSGKLSYSGVKIKKVQKYWFFINLRADFSVID